MAGGAAFTLSVASSLAPLAMRSSRQSSLPSAAAHMRAVLPSCGGEGAAHHAVSGAGRRGAEEAEGGWGLAARGVWQGDAWEMQGRCRGDSGTMHGRYHGDIGES